MITAQIGTNWLVTAAHCLFEENEQIPTRSLAVLLGLHDRRKRTEEFRYLEYQNLVFINILFRKRITVSDVFIHDNFTSGEPTDDIALIRIGRSKIVTTKLEAIQMSG